MSPSTVFFHDSHIKVYAPGSGRPEPRGGIICGFALPPVAASAIARAMSLRDTLPRHAAMVFLASTYQDRHFDLRAVASADDRSTVGGPTVEGSRWDPDAPDATTARRSTPPAGPTAGGGGGHALARPEAAEAGCPATALFLAKAIAYEESGPPTLPDAIMAGGGGGGFPPTPGRVVAEAGCPATAPVLPLSLGGGMAATHTHPRTHPRARTHAHAGTPRTRRQPRAREAATAAFLTPAGNFSAWAEKGCGRDDEHLRDVENMPAMSCMLCPSCLGIRMYMVDLSVQWSCLIVTAHAHILYDMLGSDFSEASMSLCASAVLDCSKAVLSDDQDKGCPKSFTQPVGEAAPVGFPTVLLSTTYFLSLLSNTGSETTPTSFI